MQGCLECCKVLVQHGAKVNATNGRANHSALHYAVSAKDKEKEQICIILPCFDPVSIIYIFYYFL